MSKSEVRSLLSRLLPYVTGKKQMTALFTFVLLLALSHSPFDAPHLHVEPAPTSPTVTVAAFASGGNMSATISGWGSLLGTLDGTLAR